MNNKPLFSSDRSNRIRYSSSFSSARKTFLHLNVLLHSIWQINQLITREQDREIILKESCNIFVQNRGYRLIWIGLPDREAKHIVVATVVTIAEHLQMTVIVKGVETGDQQKTLIVPKCRRFQGHYMGRPIRADQVFAEQKTTDK